MRGLTEFFMEKESGMKYSRLWKFWDDQDAAYRWLAEGEAEIKKKFTVTVHW